MVPPSCRLIDVEAAPDVTALLLAVSDAPECVEVGVTWMEDTVLDTSTEYSVVPAANVGESVPDDGDRALRLESTLGCRVTATVYVCVVVPS